MMQQNKNNDVKQQMSEEELQRTQVLNFETFKKIAHFEKVNSKKPAAILALLGLLLIVIGGSYPIVQSQMEKRKGSNNTNIQARKETPEVNTTKLGCTKSNVNSDGTNEVIKVNYTFKDNKLSSLTKEYTLTIVEGNQNAQAAIQSFKTALVPYLRKQNGYSLSVKDIENGVVTTTEVDYSNLDVSTIPTINQENYRFNVIYIKDSTKESIYQDVTTQHGFNCE